MEERMDIDEVIYSDSPPNSSSAVGNLSKSNICKTIGVREWKKMSFVAYNSEQKILVCSQYSNNSWVLMRSFGNKRPLQKKDFSICCKIPVNTFLHLPSEVEYDLDPFLCDEENSAPESPVLRIVSPFHNCDLSIEASLFAALFGHEASLRVATSSVCLIGFPDGRVFWWQHPNDDACLLYNLRQPIVDILEGPDGSLLIIGFHGKILCICCQQKELKYSCAFLSGTVTSTCYKDKIIFHTTSSWKLFRSTVSIDMQGQVLIIQSLLPVTSAKQVMYDPSVGRVRFLDAENVPSDLPQDHLDESCSLTFQREKLRSLTEAISEQSLRIQQLTEMTEKYSGALHDLTCAAWLLTSEHGRLDCSCTVLPISCERSEFMVRVTFKGLAKLHQSGRWSVCASLSQNPTIDQTRKLSKSMPISNDTVSMDMAIRLCWGSKISIWGGTFRPPLDLECSVLFNGNTLDLCPCSVLQIPLRKIVLDEFFFLSTVGTSEASKYDQTVDRLLYSLAEEKKRFVVERPVTPKLPSMTKCSIGFLTSNETNTGTVLGGLLPVAVSEISDIPIDRWLLTNSVRFSLHNPTNVVNNLKNMGHIYIDTNCISVLAAFHRASVERLKNLKLKTKDNVIISKEAFITARRLLSKFQEAQSGRSLEHAANFYLLLRNELSANLPIL